ncbi:hypothetical protein HETIRDRAFT_106357 [Heterobasidion irregulare TC 32-1]|uniref:Uncharacterized protein n=1 Tax=Heterobasidion irregulare (strain TC 32-1) TaxID=747525 RepID=W4JQ67_HETIT|nr:uncharacterized protein HETIRDRAFT_106357 [Heterobasidion irregulare TC 32-1]ETW75678.1 hypothetical protein HETIRDRAFT_106357 [Heterobasidion irregulare TC 32-1]
MPYRLQSGTARPRPDAWVQLQISQDRAQSPEQSHDMGRDLYLRLGYSAYGLRHAPSPDQAPPQGRCPLPFPGPFLTYHEPSRAFPPATFRSTVVPASEYNLYASDGLLANATAIDDQ